MSLPSELLQQQLALVCPWLRAGCLLEEGALEGGVGDLERTMGGSAAGRCQAGGLRTVQSGGGNWPATCQPVHPMLQGGACNDMQYTELPHTHVPAGMQIQICYMMNHVRMVACPGAEKHAVRTTRQPTMHRRDSANVACRDNLTSA